MWSVKISSEVFLQVSSHRYSFVSDTPVQWSVHRCVGGASLKNESEAKTSFGVWDAEAFVRMLIFHLQTEAWETQTWKFNVFRLSALSELPLPVGYWSPFPCLLLALLCSPATARVLEQDLSSHTSTDGPTPCILIWRSEESVARWGVAFMSRFNRKKSPVRSEMLSDLRNPGGRSRPVFVFLLSHWT